MRIAPNIASLMLCVVFFAASCAKETKIPEATPSPDEIILNPAGTPQTVGTTSGQAPTAPITTITTATPGVCCQTENVIVVVVDGPRYTETFGDYTKQNIPNLYNIYTQGVMVGDFQNKGTTNTDSGHDAIVTGNYEDLENTGQVLPQYPSIFQNFLKETGKSADKAWVITSKDKLAILGNCKYDGWGGRYMPRTDCGNRGLGTGYRSDDTTLAHAKDVITQYHPNLMLINFKDPDSFGHSNMWNEYIGAIKKTDAYIKELFDVIQTDPIYRGRTTLIVTNDHGRHTTGTADGFVNHGCGCEGCRHIEFVGYGPDFKKGAAIQTAYEQIDISKTIGKLLHFDMPLSKGRVMTDLFN